MQDLRETLQAAAPQPAERPDPREIWRQGRRRGRARILVATVGLAAVCAMAVVVAGGYGRTLLDRGRPQPADGGLVNTEEGTLASRPDGSVILASVEIAKGPVTHTNMTIVELQDGASRPVELEEFAPGDAQFTIEPIGEDLVFRGSSGTEAGTYAVDPALEGDPVLLGESWYFVPSATEGRAWLMILDPDSPPTVRGLAGVREVTFDGEVTVPDTAPPPGWVVGAVNQGLVLQNDELQVWDPLTDQIVTRLDGVFPIDTQGDVVAWCDDGCPEVHLTNVATGGDVVVEPPEGAIFEETSKGAFSLDGRSLAVPVKVGGETQVALVDVVTMTVRVIPDQTLSPYHLMTWSVDGEWLVFDTGEGHLSALHRETGHVVEIPLDRAQSYFAIAAF